MKKLALKSFAIVLAIVASLYFTTPASAVALSGVSVGIAPPIFQQSSTKTVPVGNVQVDLFDTAADGSLVFRQSVDRSGSSLGRLYNDRGVVLRLYGNGLTNNGKKVDKLVAVFGDLNADLKPTKDKKGVWQFPKSAQLFELNMSDGLRHSLDVALDQMTPGSYQVAFYAFDPKGVRTESRVDTGWLTLKILPLPIITTVKYAPSTDLVDIIQFGIVRQPVAITTPPAPNTNMGGAPRNDAPAGNLPTAPPTLNVPPTQQGPERSVPDAPAQTPPTAFTPAPRDQPAPANLNPPTTPVVRIEDSLAALTANDAKLADVVNNHESRIVRLESAFPVISVAFVKNYRGPSVVETTAGLDIVNDVILLCLQPDGTWQARMIWAPVEEKYREVFMLPGSEAYRMRIGVARYTGIKEPFKVGFRLPSSNAWQFATINPSNLIQGKILVVPVDQGGVR